MAKYEHFRTYVVANVDKKERSAAFVAPKGRAYWPRYAWDIPRKILAGLKVGQKVKFVRLSDAHTTLYRPRFK